MTTQADNFPIDFAVLAREIAMDIYPVEDILELHKLTDEQWIAIQEHPGFQAMLNDLVLQYNTAGSIKERVRLKAAIGLEISIDTYITDISDTAIPLNQRVEAGKFLARLGELDPGLTQGGAGGGGGVVINIVTKAGSAPVTIEGEVLRTAPQHELAEDVDQ
jgi:hypothetical protein